MLIFPVSSLFPCSLQRWRGWGWCDCVVARARHATAPGVLSEWPGPLLSQVSQVHVGLGHFTDTHSGPDHLPPHTAPSLCTLRPRLVLWSSKHQHISLTHKGPPRTPMSQSSASFIWPQAKATTTPLPHVLRAFQYGLFLPEFLPG